MAKRYWRIVGHKSLHTIYETKIPVGLLTEQKLIELLKCLTANGNLAYGEIIGAYVKRKTKNAHGLLDVQKFGYGDYMCGTDPTFCADIVDEQGKGWSALNCRGDSWILSRAP